MITFFIRGQTLAISSPVVAANSVNYLTAKFTFQTADWDGLTKIAHFRCGDLYAEIGLADDEITADRGMNLTEGKWTVSVTGHLTEGGELVQRATTHTVTLTVVPSGIGEDGEPLPDLASYGEQVLAEVQGIRAEVDEMLGKIKNERDGSFVKLWAGSEAQYSAAEKSADTIYLIGLMGGDST